MSELIPKSAEIPDSDYVIIGGTGDLALRKIFPALFWRYLAGQITTEFRLIIAARSSISVDEFAGKLRPFCADAIADEADGEDHWAGFIALIRIVALDAVSGEGGAELAELVNRRLSPERPLIFYLAIAPTLFGAACETISKNGLAVPQSRLVVEKPLGNDGASARAINKLLLDVFDEAQIYRIDHYLGKETVQNLMALRFANTIFESQWGNHAIDHVQITVAEADWETIRNQTRNLFEALSEKRKEAPIAGPYTYVEASVTIDGHRFPQVGLRKKGFIGSQSTTGPSLKIKLNHLDKEAGIEGLTNLTFNNNKQDSTLVNQYMGYAFFNAAGAPAPRCAFAKVSVNGVNLGVYSHVETIRKTLIKREFGNDNGTLYEGTVVDFREGWEGSFERKLRGTKKETFGIERLYDQYNICRQLLCRRLYHYS